MFACRVSQNNEIYSHFQEVIGLRKTFIENCKHGFDDHMQVMHAVFGQLDLRPQSTGLLTR